MKEKLEKLHLQTHVKIHTALLLVGIIIIVFGATISEFENLHPVAWIGLAIIAVGMIWRFLFIKCPHCGSKMYDVRSLPEYCPNCGKKLVKEEV